MARAWAERGGNGKAVHRPERGCVRITSRSTCEKRWRSGRTIGWHGRLVRAAGPPARRNGRRRPYVPARFGQFTVTPSEPTQEIRDHRPHNANKILTDHLANRIATVSEGTRPGIFSQVTRSRAVSTVPVNDNGRISPVRTSRGEGDGRVACYHGPGTNFRND